MNKLRTLTKRLKDKALDAGLGALIVGALASLFGVDLAPTEVDVLVTAGAILVTVVERWRAKR